MKIRKLLSLVAAAAFGAAVTGGVLAATAATTPSSTVYYACLSNGTLSKVGTAAPTCAAPAKQVSWNQTGPQGPAGNTVLSGNGAPSTTIGVAGNFYIETSNHKLFGPATHTCNPLPCHTIWGTGTSLVGPAGAAGQGPAYQTSGTETITDDGYAVIAELTLPDGYFTLNATIGTFSSFGANGMYCDLSVNYDNGLDGVIDTQYNANPGEVTLSGSVFYSPAHGTGYALVWCGPYQSNDSGDQASVTAHFTATQVSSLDNE
ncbi:MAG TPA: hypothetical protein VGO03_12780 [Acidimicrobiia bacterium]|jgi:hypothetical protein